LSEIVHAAHAVLAGVWLGGVIFTMAVVSPALKAMKWSESERVLVRSKIGNQYAKVGGTNLALLVVFAVLDGSLTGFGTALYAEYLLLAALVGLVAAHGAYFGHRLRGLAEGERLAGSGEEAKVLAERRRNLQKVSLPVSWASLVVSLVVAWLAAGF
jgi:uncharacterized membrane protein